MNSIIFTIPDSEWISANDRLHWAAKARRTAALAVLVVSFLAAAIVAVWGWIA